MLDQAVDQATEVLRRRRNVAYNAKNNFAIETAEMQVQRIPQHRRDGGASPRSC